MDVGGCVMAVQHTPGPWLALDYTGTDEPAWHVVPGDFHGTIATLDPEQSANARLIAAAPDLLAALEALVANLDEGDFISTTRIDAARAALSKARGQS